MFEIGLLIHDEKDVLIVSRPVINDFANVSRIRFADLPFETLCRRKVFLFSK